MMKRLNYKSIRSGNFGNLIFPRGTFSFLSSLFFFDLFFLLSFLLG